MQSLSGQAGIVGFCPAQALSLSVLDLIAGIGEPPASHAALIYNIHRGTFERKHGTIAQDSRVHNRLVYACAGATSLNVPTDGILFHTLPIHACCIKTLFFIECVSPAISY